MSDDRDLPHIRSSDAENEPISRADKLADLFWFIGIFGGWAFLLFVLLPFLVRTALIPLAHSLAELIK